MPRSRIEFGLAFMLGAAALVLGQVSWARWSGSVPPVEVALPGPIDVNAAPPQHFAQLPGIGPQLAARIVAHRQMVGRFESVEDLTQVPGIGPAVLERVRPFCRVGETPSHPAMLPSKPSRRTDAGKTVGIRPGKGLPNHRIDVNHASATELMTLPGIGPTLAERIIDERQRNGPYVRLEDLFRVRGIGNKTLDKLAPHVEFGKPGPSISTKSDSGTAL